MHTISDPQGLSPSVDVYWSADEDGEALVLQQAHRVILGRDQARELGRQLIELAGDDVAAARARQAFSRLL